MIGSTTWYCKAYNFHVKRCPNEHAIIIWINWSNLLKQNGKWIVKKQDATWGCTTTEASLINMLNIQTDQPRTK
jgi:hypothetical protein